MQVVESSSLFSILFREAFSHPYISFFHLLVNVFSVIQINFHIEPPEVGLVQKLLMKFVLVGGAVCANPTCIQALLLKNSEI